MRFLTRPEVRERFEGKSVAIVGSGPSVLDNQPGFVDSHDIVLRVNNYKLSEPTGRRTDVYYSFFGSSIIKTAEELQRDGVTLCMCKCPNAHAIKSDWHRIHGKMLGVDFRKIYQRRTGWWFCDTYVPDTEDFLLGFSLLRKHVPTTGFAAILDVLSFNPRTVYLTGFDFFRSGKHNVDRPWRVKKHKDPIAHVPEQELVWLEQNVSRFPITVDVTLAGLLRAPSRTSGMIFDYKGSRYPDYIRHGNACQFIAPFAAQFCKGKGLDVGAGKWPLPGALAIDAQTGGNAMALPIGPYDYVFSSHCLEHLTNPVAAIEHWKTRIKPGGVLFLYLPDEAMEYWLPQNNRKHLHTWRPGQMARMLEDLGFVDVLHSERDLAWSFAVVGFVPL